MIKPILGYFRLIRFFLTFILFFPCILFAQSAILIQGIVQIDNGESLAFATVAAQQAEQGKVLQGVFADEDGKFQLEISGLDSVYLEVSMIGYLSKRKWVYPKKSAEAGTITLEKNEQNLEAVIVTAKRNKLTRKIDRLVVDVDNNAAFAGRPSIALLSSLPGCLCSGWSNLD